MSWTAGETCLPGRPAVRACEICLIPSDVVSVQCVFVMGSWASQILVTCSVKPRPARDKFHIVLGVFMVMPCLSYRDLEFSLSHTGGTERKPACSYSWSDHGRNLINLGLERRLSTGCPSVGPEFNKKPNQLTKKQRHKHQREQSHAVPRRRPPASACWGQHSSYLLSLEPPTGLSRLILQRNTPSII